MLFVGLFRTDRARDYEFWSVLWQGQGPPADFELVAAYNLLTDLRVFVFKAESIGSIRWLDRLNMVGSFECHPALDQTGGYHAAVARDLAGFESFLRGRGAAEQTVRTQVGFRERAMATPTLWHALAHGRAFQEGMVPDEPAPS